MLQLFQGFLKFVVLVIFLGGMDLLLLAQDVAAERELFEAAMQEPTYRRQLGRLQNQNLSLPGFGYFVQGLEAELSDHLAEALGFYTSAVKQNQNPHYLAARARVYRLTSDKQASLADLDLILSSGLDIAESHLQRGLWRMNEPGAAPMALSEFNRALELQPGYVEALLARGDLYIKMNAPHEALADYELANEKAPDDDRVLAALGETLAVIGKDREAMFVLNKALLVNESNARAAAVRGRLHLKREYIEDGLVDLQTALESDPDNVEIRKLRAGVFLRQRQYANARAELTQAISVNNNSAELYYLRGLANFELKLNDQALADFTRSLQLDKSLSAAYVARARLYLRLKRTAAACADLAEAGQHPEKTDLMKQHCGK